MFDIPRFDDLPVGEKSFLSEDRKYGYMRTYKLPKICVFIMLNPSGEDESDTIENCKVITMNEGARGMVCVNLFAYISGTADILKEDVVNASKKETALDIIGEENYMYLASALSEPDALIIVAWGDEYKDLRSSTFKNAVGFEKRVQDVENMIKKYAGDSEIQYLIDKKKPKDNPAARISHPYWLADAKKRNNESKEDRAERMKKEVLSRYDLASYPPLPPLPPLEQ